MRRAGLTSLVFALSVLLLGSLLPAPSRGAAGAQVRASSGLVVARVSVRSREELERLAASGLDLLETREGDDLFVLTTDEGVRRLREQGWRVSVDERKTALVRSQRPELRQSSARTTPTDAPTTSADSFGVGYLTVPEMRDRLVQRAAEYPNLAEFFTYGDSWQRINGGPAAGHDLFGIKLTNQQTTDPAGKPVFFLVAAIHARELSTSELALRFVDHLLSGYGVDADATWLLDEHVVVVIPVLNPDGRRLAEQALMQRKNLNDDGGNDGCADPPDAFNQIGVDLNRNHDFKWGTVNTPDVNPCDQVFPGRSASSEPETSAFQDYVRRLIPDQRDAGDADAAPPTTRGVLITLHSYANLVMWPWGHTSAPAPNGAELALIGGKFAGYNGYTPQQANALYPSSGKTDEWAYGELGIPAYVFEVGIGEGECGGFMPPYSCLDGGFEGSFWPRNLPAFLYAARIARAPYQLAHGPSPEAAAAIPSSTAGQFELRARLDERRNGGQPIAAAEYYLDTPPWRGGTPVPMAAADGVFDGTVEVVTAGVGPLEGERTLYVRGRDAGGNWGPVRAVFSPGDSCAYAVSPTAQSFAAGGGAGSINVTAGANCGWAAGVDAGASWISVTSGDLGGGNGTVAYTVAANNTSSPRSGTMIVAGQTFTVTQAALQLNSVSLSPSTAAGGQTSVGTVTLSGPAPAGGALITLSSSNGAVAAVPASVTVAAGAASQTFNVTTQAVATTTGVNVSATYSGTTRTAVLTVNPAAAAPTGLTASTGNVGRIELRWIDNSNNETGFRIERCPGTTCTNFTLLTTVGPNTITYRNSSLPGNTSYRYRVRANTSVGFSVYSNIATGKTK